MKASQQEYLIDLVLQKIAKPELSKIMQETLNISKATSYKYMNHSSDINYDSMMSLLQHPKIREVLNQRQILRDEGTVEWQYKILTQKYEDTNSYLNSLLIFLKLLDSKDSKIVLASYENPIFYYMYCPELMAFKLYCWSKTIWNNSDYYSSEFNPKEILTSSVLNILSEICNRFNSISSIEYWTESILDNTIRQITYFNDIYLINNREIVRTLIDGLYELVGILRQTAQTATKLLSDKKGQGAQTTIFKNEIYYTNNIIMVESPHQNKVFSAFDNPNFMYTSDARIISRVVEWLNGMRPHCTSLTHTNEIIRNEFFGYLEQQVDRMENKIQRK